MPIKEYISLRRRMSVRRLNLSLRVVVLIAIFCLGLSRSASAAPSTPQFLGAKTQLNLGSLSPSGLQHVAVDSSGNVYASDQAGNSILKISSDGTASTLSLPGITLNQPQQIALDAAGDLYVADSGNNRVVELSASGTASVVTISGCTLSQPQGLAIDSAGNLYLSQTPSAGSGQVLKVATDGTCTQVSSSPYTLQGIEDIAIDASGNLYIADIGSTKIYEIPASGAAINYSSVHGLPAMLPYGLAVDAAGTVYISDANNGNLWSVDSSGSVSTSALSAYYGIAVDASKALYTANLTALYKIQATAVDVGHVSLKSTGNTISLSFNAYGTALTGVQALVASSSTGDFTIANTSTCAVGTTAACTLDITFTPQNPGLRKGAAILQYGSASSQRLIVPIFGYADAPVAAVSPAGGDVVNTTAIAGPFQSVMDGAGNIYVTSYLDSKLYEIVAGSSTPVAVSTGSYTLSSPAGLAMDPAGNLFIADSDNSRILERQPDGTTSVLSITGLNRNIFMPTALSFDRFDNLYIADYGNGRVVKVTPSGVGSVLSTGSFTFDSSFTGIDVDSSGTLYIADRDNARVVKVPANGAASVVPVTGFTLNTPQGVAVDGNDNVYILDSNNMRVLRVTTAGNVSMVSFRGVSLGSFDYGVTASAGGQLLVSDFSNNRLVGINTGTGGYTFANTNVGATSSDSPLAGSITNLGNQPLVFTSAPTYTNDFVEGTSSNTICSDTTTLTSGTSCDVPVKFTPQTSGFLSANLVATDNALNVPGATQTIAVFGTGISIGDATSVTVTSSPASVVYGQTTTIVAHVADTVTSGTIPTGTVSFTDTVGSTTTTLNGSVAIDASGNATLSDVTLSGIGTHVITASYAGVTSSFVASTGTGSVTMTQASVTLSSSPSPVSTTVGSYTILAITGTSQVSTASGPTGSISYTLVDGSGTTVKSGTDNFYAVTGSSSGNIVLSALAAGSYTLHVTYAGDTNYTAATEIKVPVTVSLIAPTVSWTPASAINYGTSLSALLNATASASVTLEPARTAPVIARSAPTTQTVAVPGTFTYTANGAAVTAATVLNAGTYALTVTFTPTDTTTYSSATASATLTVAKIAGTLTLTTSPNPSTLSNFVSMAATLSSGIGAPTGSISFYDGATLLGTSTVAQGGASFQTSSLSAGSHTLTAVYSGDTNFGSITSSAVTQQVVDLTLSLASTSSTSATVQAGGAATYTLTIGPATGTTFPGAISFTATNLPTGATATFSPQSITAGSGSTNVTLTIQTAAKTTAMNRDLRLTGTAALALIFLPLAGRLRKAGKRLSQVGVLMLLVILGFAASVGLTGCGGSSSSTTTATATSYTVQVTATSGSLQRTTNLTLNVQ